mmetsp:Transcript_49353/g.145756  ORF Transcript_49353/g.145756 Transcript_49353/m.145756 type:complete len:216 (+) Transcript_49353:1071-1718(+)
MITRFRSSRFHFMSSLHMKYSLWTKTFSSSSMTYQPTKTASVIVIHSGGTGRRSCISISVPTAVKMPFSRITAMQTRSKPLLLTRAAMQPLRGGSFRFAHQSSHPMRNVRMLCSSRYSVKSLKSDSLAARVSFSLMLIARPRDSLARFEPPMSMLALETCVFDFPSGRELALPSPAGALAEWPFAACGVRLVSAWERVVHMLDGRVLSDEAPLVS